MKIKDLINGMMSKIKSSTTLSSEDQKQVKQSLTEFWDDKVVDIWTLPEINVEVEKITGQPVQPHLLDHISEKIYDEFFHGKGLSYHFIDEQILNTIEERYSKILVTPALEGPPPEFPVDKEIADKFIAVGERSDSILKDSLQAGNFEVITDMGRDEDAALAYTERMGYAVDIKILNEIDSDNSLEPSM